MIDKVADLEYTLTDSVSEALLLEANLIKRYQPRFNVRLKDDKSYPYIRITLGDDFPRIERTRKLVNDGSRYFGPYASASSVDEAMNLIRRLFPFRTCTIDIREGERALRRPCLLYHIKRCQGPCIEAVDEATPTGPTSPRSSSSSRGARRRWSASSAARWRRPPGGPTTSGPPRCGTRCGRSSGRWRTRRWPPSPGPSSTCWASPGRATRRRSRSSPCGPGSWSGATSTSSRRRPASATTRRSPASCSSTTPARRRCRRRSWPRGCRPRPRTWRRSWRPAAAGASGCSSPSAGEKRRLVDLAGRNAADHLGREQARWLADDGKTLVALEELAAALGLAGPPLRIECYDISTIQGRETVGSMVVFEDGRPRTGAYRRFRIKDVAGQDDFASHAEMLRRRLYRGKAGEEGSAEEQRWALPDLIVVDGGKGQLAADVAVLRELGLDEIPIAGLAKEREELFLPGRPDPVDPRPRPRRRSTSSSGSATRRIASPSPTTATCAGGPP